MDGLTIIAIAIGLIIVMLAIFAFITYIFLNIFRRPSASQAVKAMRPHGGNTKK